MKLNPFLPLLLSLASAGLLCGQTVTITAPDDAAAEAGYYPGVFQVARTGDTAAPLPVALAYSGTATPWEDYAILPAEVVIPAGAAAVEVMVDPVNDGDAEGEVAETVVATLQPGAGYTVGSPASATVTIADNEVFTDTLKNTAPLHYKAVQDSPTSIVLHWTDNFTMETKFRVQWRVEGTSTWSQTDVAANTTSHRIAGLAQGSAYEFRVLAFRNANQSLTQNQMRQVALDAAGAPEFSTFEQWRAATGLDGGLRAGWGRTGDDPDGDNCINLFEYLLGRDPLASDAGGLRVSPAGGASLLLEWPGNSGLLDAGLQLQESVDLTGWNTSTLPVTAGADMLSAAAPIGSTPAFYRLAAVLSGPEHPSSMVTCWGDSLTATTPGYPSKLASALGRTVQNCGIGGDTSIQIMDRMRGLQVTTPYPATATGTVQGTPLRIVASRTLHSRIMNPGNRSSWAAYAATIADVSRVEFLNKGVKIGESSAPLAATVTSNRVVDPKRINSPGHPFANGDVVWFPAGPLPSPLVAGKTYYVRDADAGGFSLAEDDNFVSITASSAAPNSVFTCTGHTMVDGDTVYFPTTPLPGPLVVGRTYHVRDAAPNVISLAETPGGPAITMTYNLANVNIRGPVRDPLTLGADFAAPTAIRGPFVLDWTHPGGDTSISLRTHTDRDANTFVFWLGRNNSSRPHEIYADIHAAVEQIRALNGRFLIMGVLTASTETAGNSYYYNAINLNSLLRREFPNEFIDIRGRLIQAGQSAGQDAADRASDIVPSSLRSDTLHLNDAGYQVVADVLAAEISARGW